MALLTYAHLRGLRPGKACAFQSERAWPLLSCLWGLQVVLSSLCLASWPVHSFVTAELESGGEVTVDPLLLGDDTVLMAHRQAIDVTLEQRQELFTQDLSLRAQSRRFPERKAINSDLFTLAWQGQLRGERTLWNWQLAASDADSINRRADELQSDDNDGGRSRTYLANFTVARSMSERLSLELAATAQQTRFRNTGDERFSDLNDFRFGSLGSRLSWQQSERLAFTMDFRANRFATVNPDVPSRDRNLEQDTLDYFALAGVTVLLTPQDQFQLSAGVRSSDQRAEVPVVFAGFVFGEFTRYDRSRGVVAEMAYRHQRPRWSVGLNADRSARPSALGSLQLATTGSLQFQYRASERAKVRFDTRVSQRILDDATGAESFDRRDHQVTLAFEYDLTQQMSLSSSFGANYRRRLQDQVSDRSQTRLLAAFAFRYEWSDRNE